MWYAIGVAIMVVITIIVRIALCKSASENQCCCKRVIKNILKIFIYFLSLDYHLASVCKNKHQNDTQKGSTHKSVEQNYRKNYIQCANHINLIITFIFVAISFVLKNVLMDCGWLCEILIGFIAYRFASRTVEINVSFLLDVFDKNNNSGTNKWQRIKLAFLSLIEEAVLFAGIYLFFYDGEICKSILSGLHSFILSPVSDKCCCCQESCGLFSFVTIYQVICSIILITISFATYISGDKKKENVKSDEEQTDEQEMVLDVPNDIINIDTEDDKKEQKKI